MKKKIVLGILAHVDAGKTTLSESMLYLSGSIRKFGRVDHKDAFLDTFELERERGITIFSKQAVFSLGDTEVTLLDTPGHVDFSAEMERTLQVLDYAVLVINGSDGVQGHTQTLWKLLKRYGIPVFLFINKMDQDGTDRQKLLGELKSRLSSDCIDFDPAQEKQIFHEQLAACDEQLLEQYLEEDQIDEREIKRLILERKVFPCYFGSALKMQGVEEFLQALSEYMVMPGYSEDFGAKVYKIARDSQGARLTYMKVTGGCLKVKDVITEKVDQIRIYSGAKYDAVSEVSAGTVCAVTGLSDTYPGQGLGVETESHLPVLEPVLTYQVMLPEGCDVHAMIRNLRMLEEEEPQLHISWNEELKEIHALLMGEVQIEILQRLIKERFGVSVGFGTGNIVYKETITKPVEGVGHFEPLRHYAEVHLLLEPGEPGSGLVFDTVCSEDELDRNWQRLILTHLDEKEHVGVLTGSAVTDMKITLIAGRAHQKHTEGGDFRQATYRAVRQGLKKAESVLLEPYYEFRLEVPPESIGRAMSDIQKRKGTFESPKTEGEYGVITGSAPVASMRDYQSEVISYTKGRGRITFQLKGYEPCSNAQEIIEAIGYDSESDLQNPTGSVFCSHGAGFVVKWNEVEDHMHVESRFRSEENEEKPADCTERQQIKTDSGKYGQDEKELEAIFERTYGPVRRKTAPEVRRTASANADMEVPGRYRKKKKEQQEEYLLVDGYNIIYAWEELKELAKKNLMSARDKLMDILSDYQGYRGMTVILVFDAYKVQGNQGSIFKYHNIHVVYTKEAETADQYIEKTVHRIGRTYQVTVATSDAMEQVIILGQGGHRMSADGLRTEVEEARREVKEQHMTQGTSGRTYLGDHLPEEVARQLREDGAD